jgi:tRNA pseudouridine32 synthase / 23S rRNA pseudouridine746 synthase
VSPTANGASHARGDSMPEASVPCEMVVGKPPDRDGVGASVIATTAGEWLTYLDFLAQRFAGVNHDEWLARINSGDVLDEHGATINTHTPYRANSKLFYYRNIADELRIPFAETVLFQDDWIVVADKPHFLPVTPAGRYVQETLLVRLKRSLGIDTLAPMHRIDRDTAGLVLFTIQPHTRDAYQKLFRERRIEKTYEAIAPWRAELAAPVMYRSRLVQSESFMQMQTVSGDANALTGIEMDAIDGALARYILRPLTGQKHQLRAHMAAIGAPILNDRIYPVLLPSDSAEPDYSQPLQLLAKSIAFIDPITGQSRSFASQRTLAAWPRRLAQ